MFEQAALLALLPLPLLAYGMAARQQHRRGKPWPRGRLRWFTLGMTLLALGLMLSQVAPHRLEWHMAQHLILAMLAPIALVMAAPLSLTLRTLPRRRARTLARVLRSAPLRLLAHPLVILWLNLGGMALLYLTPLFVWSQQNALVHTWVLLHFIAAGLLFSWLLVGPDPGPRRPGYSGRLALLLAAAAGHAVLAKLLYAWGLPSGTAHSLESIRSAAQIMYYGGDIAELALAVILLRQWIKTLPAPGPGVEAHRAGGLTGLWQTLFSTAR